MWKRWPTRRLCHDHERPVWVGRRFKRDWKREAIDKLKNYEARRAALENIPGEIKRLESACSGIRSATAGGVHIAGRS